MKAFVCNLDLKMICSNVIFFQGHIGRVSALTSMIKDDRLVTVGRDGQICMYNTNQRWPLWKMLFRVSKGVK